MQALPNATKDLVGKKPLADRFDELLGKLDQIINEAITALVTRTQLMHDDIARRELKGAVRRLDDYVFQLRIWASDLTCQDFTSTLELSAVQDLEAHDVLRVLDGHQLPIVDSLHGNFAELEVAALKISGSLKVLNIPELGNAVHDIEQSLQELDSQKPEIQKSIIGLSTC